MAIKIPVLYNIIGLELEEIVGLFSLLIYFVKVGYLYYVEYIISRIISLIKLKHAIIKKNMSYVNLNSI